MNRIIFTKKHILVSSAIGFMLILFVLGSWFLLLSPQNKKLTEKNTRIVSLQKEVTKIGQEFHDLHDRPTLLESEIVNNMPIIPNGIDLQSYFDELKTVDSSTSISIKNIKFDHSLVFPETITAERQLRKSKIGFDVIGDSSRDLIAFVDRLEQGNRFIKVQDVIYRASEAIADEGSYSYSTSVVVDMYYLSLFETGKPIVDNSLQ